MTFAAVVGLMDITFFTLFWQTEAQKLDIFVHSCYIWK